MSRIPRGLSHFDPCLPWRCHPSARPGFPARRRHCGQSSPAKITGGKKTTAFGKPSKCSPPTPTGSFGPKPAAGQPANPSRPSPCRGCTDWRSDSRSGSGSPKRCHMAETPADALMPATFAVELPKVVRAGRTNSLGVCGIAVNSLQEPGSLPIRNDPRPSLILGKALKHVLQERLISRNVALPSQRPVA